MAGCLNNGNYDTFYQHLNHCVPDVFGPYRTISAAAHMENPEFLTALINKNFETNLLLALRCSSASLESKYFERICDRYSEHPRFLDILQSAYVFAMHNYCLRHLRVFLQYGVDIQLPSEIIPGILENQSAMPLLVENGLNLEVRVNNHDNVFIATVLRRRNFDTVRNLLDLGVNLTANPAKLSEILVLAISEKEEDIACRLILTGAIDLVNIYTTAGSILRQAVYFNLKSVVKAILETGCDVNTAYFDNTTPLHTAVQRDLPEMIDLLLEAGADTSIREFGGQTPYIMARELRRTECINRLAPKSSESLKRKFT